MELTRHLDELAIHDLIDGELDPADARAARVHLSRCAECRAARDERAMVVTALRWYAAAPPGPPAGYWDSFWDRFPGPASPAAARVTRRRRVALPLAAAAAAATLVAGGWWARSALDTTPAPFAAASPPMATAPPLTAADLDLVRDYEFFERVTIAVGSVDPMSKGIVLAGMGAP